MTKITIHGFYGFGNLGDEAILKAILQEFMKTPNIQLVVFSKTPKQTAKKYGIKSVNSKIRKGLLRIIWEIKTSNLFILGGGGLLKDYGKSSSNLKHTLKLLRLAQKLNVKTALLAVGVENIRYKDSKKLLSDILNKVDLITVRDCNSKQILIDIKITNKIKVVTDPSVLLANINISKIKDISKPPKVIICIRHWFDKGFFIENPEINDNFIRSVSLAADYLIEHYNAKIEFIPMRITSYDDDRIVAQQVVSYMKHKEGAHIHSYAPEVDEFIEILQQSSLVIGMRLHSLIIGTSVGVPVIGLEYMPKVRAYMDSISQGGYSLDLETITSEKLIRIIEKTFNKYKNRSQIIASEVYRLQKIARDNITELVKLSGIKQ